MFESTSFGKYLNIANKELSVLKYRHSIIANNVANAETPNFKRSVVNFESHLKEALDSEKKVPGFTAAVTHKDHASFHTVMDYKKVKPRRILDWNTQALNNGNNVILEQETNNQLKTVLSYNLISRTISDSFERINIVVR